MIRYPIKDRILFESKFFWSDKPQKLKTQIKNFKLPPEYKKQFPKIKDFFMKERHLATGKEDENNKICQFLPGVQEAMKHFINLEFLFRPHFQIPSQHLPNILELFNFFCYFYDLIEGPAFDMEELYVCLQKNEYSNLAHDIHICIINLYLKEYIQKNRISFEKENGFFFPILNEIVMKEKHRHVLTRMFWMEFLKEIIIRRLLEEDSVEKEVDELLVEIQGLEIEEPEEELSEQDKVSKKEGSSEEQEGQIIEGSLFELFCFSRKLLLY
jgi:hypothetical protein